MSYIHLLSVNLNPNGLTQITENPTVDFSINPCHLAFGHTVQIPQTLELSLINNECCLHIFCIPWCRLYFPLVLVLFYWVLCPVMCRCSLYLSLETFSSWIETLWTCICAVFRIFWSSSWSLYSKLSLKLFLSLWFHVDHLGVVLSCLAPTTSQRSYSSKPLWQKYTTVLRRYVFPEVPWPFISTLEKICFLWFSL